LLKFDPVHEVGIIQSALASAVQQAQSAGANRIHQLSMRVGAMTGVVPDALAFAFEVVRQGTLAAEAQLKIETVAATCWCAACEKEFASEDFLFQCPQCGLMSAELRHGRELELVSVEIS
jgi:hydrogenase nickel incorporation protein HypA/HybF